jgi:hypothetical protein
VDALTLNCLMRPILFTLLLAMTFAGCAKRRMPCVYEIPEGFTGWILVEFERTDCPPLPQRNGKLLLAIDKNGRLCTSSKIEEGWAKDEYYYVGASRRALPATAPGGLVWSGAVGRSGVPGQKPRVYETLFIGTEQQFKDAPRAPKP